jgi:hypothetical protein
VCQTVGGRLCLAYHWGVEKPSEKYFSREQVQEQLGFFLKSRSPKGVVQCLIHADHWNFDINANYQIRKSLVKKRSSASQSNAISAINNLPNVIYAKANNVFSSYDDSYAQTTQHFTLPSSVVKFVQSLFKDNILQSGHIMELGSGQGELLELIRNLTVNVWSEEHARCLGVDGSISGVRCSAWRYPDCYWVADTVEAFMEKRHKLENDENYSWVTEPFSLIVDKTGTTFISDYEIARNLVEQINSLLAKNGAYIYIASRHFYEHKLVKNKYAKWPEGWMALLERVFDEMLTYDDELPELKGYYKRVFIKEQ